MRVKWLVGALIVLVVMNLAAMGAFVFTQLQGPDHRGWRRDQRVHRWMATQPPDEQRRLFRAMRSFHSEVRPLVEETDRLEEDLIKSMGRHPVAEAHIDSLLAQISSRRLEIARRATHHMIALGDSLSPEEREHLMDALVRMHRGPVGAGSPPPDGPPFFRRRP